MTESLPRSWVNGQPQDRVSVEDRGLSYGDGLFETMRFIDGIAPLWPHHRLRLLTGCQRLAIPAPDTERLWQEARYACAGLPDAVLRLTVTRGSGERGYALPVAPQPTRVMTVRAAPAMHQDAYREGVRVRRCALRLALQPQLAGLKHLNRLEQVLARAEWQDPDIYEGLLCDHEGHVVSAVAANLFAVIDGVLTTPALLQCGVHGVARAEVLATWSVRTRELSWEALLQAEELFLTSSVRGILPIRRLEERHYPIGPITRELQAHWRRLGFEQGT